MIDSLTTLQTTLKTTPSDPDLVLTQTYKAVINGETLKAPIRPASQQPQGSPKGGAPGTTATVRQEIDLTNIVKRLELDAEKKRRVNWELGLGAGVHNGKAYGIVSIQRNYRPDRGVELEVHLAPGLKGTEVKHKWMY
ncbi:hypothetical protein [Anaeroselena agilis]|uniref:Uncharacterized protein n=1 Tax=Anaeroselena agilis TaxID=3063788 RepID=A0ABU3NV20_9FIRM|nr:hypothetical protein [Selenomonadales bacterium 4137-cl]